MKKLLLLLVILLSLSCEYNPDKKSVITVSNIENSNISEIGIYKYTLSTSHSSIHETYLYSDSIYKLNDTLIIVKK